MRNRNLTKRQDYTLQECITFILNEIETQDQAWTDFMISLTVEQIVEPVDGSWSALDTLIHTVSWIENAVRIAHLLADPSLPIPVQEWAQLVISTSTSTTSTPK